MSVGVWWDAVGCGGRTLFGGRSVAVGIVVGEPPRDGGATGEEAARGPDCLLRKHSFAESDDGVEMYVGGDGRVL